jgi:TRAP-type C4-dicarboxylate transport system substrate-binding protein
MKRHRLSTMVAGICSILILVVLPLAIAGANPAPVAQPVVFKAVTFQPGNYTLVEAFWWFVDTVNKRSKGELTIKHAGGPEVIGGFDQAMAVKNGVVDLAWVPPAFYPSLVPGAETIAASRITCAEERRPGGAYDYLLGLHKKAGLYYFGRGQVFSSNKVSFYAFTNVKVNTPQDFAGQRIAFTSPLMEAFVKALGASLTIIPTPELYSAVDRGIVDGIILPLSTIVDGKLHETLKYVINHPFQNSGIALIMNLDTFNRLPKNLQDLLIDAAKDLEVDYPAISAKHEQENWDAIMDAGVKIIEFSPADAKWFVDTAYEVEWKKHIKKYPDLGPKLRELMSPK